MDWKFHIHNFGNYLRLERGAATNSVVSYTQDIQKLMAYLTEAHNILSPLRVQTTDLQAFIAHINTKGMSTFSQARIVSGIKAFYRYLLFEEFLKKDPAAQLTSPRLARKLPDTLHYHEVEKLLEAIDLSTAEGMRNRALIEVLYSSGLRVSELISLKVSDVHFDRGFLRVVGQREPKTYGKTSFEAFFPLLRARFPTATLLAFQSNVEGEIVNKLHESGFSCQGIVLNAGGYTHTSVAIHDAIAAIETAVVEVHLSNLYAREEFRHKNVISAHCLGTIAGFGLESYAMAVEHFIHISV